MCTCVLSTALKSLCLGMCVFYFKNLKGEASVTPCMWDISRGRQNRNVTNMNFYKTVS